MGTRLVYNLVLSCCDTSSIVLAWSQTGSFASCTLSSVPTAESWAGEALMVLVECGQDFSPPKTPLSRLLHQGVNLMAV